MPNTKDKLYTIKMAYNVIKKKVPELKYNSLRECIRVYKLKVNKDKKSKTGKVLLNKLGIEYITDYYKTIFDKRKLRATYRKDLGKIQLRRKSAIRNMKELNK